MRSSQHLTRVALLVAMLILTACVPKATIPIPAREYGQINSSGNHHLLIILRGIGGSIDDFEKHGLIDEVRARKLPFDVIIPDAHFGYYKSETLEERLKRDIIDPAKARGYRQVWLAGFSMGGMGSLFYLRKYAEDIDGVLLVSPFMGWGSIHKEIQKAGGIGVWGPEQSKLDDWQRTIWSWVHDYTRHSAEYPPIYLGFGDNDSLTGKGPQLLSEAFAPSHVFTLPGDHDYPTFKAIWTEHLNRLEEQLRALP
ncbi:MAG: alpha/beta fold hydrolase [Desulfuromonadales bacterium]|nr:alpha/beta fold hydrolase [Desulfuromonadales bacterium]